jgi:hypothetical protein
MYDLQDATGQNACRWLPNRLTSPSLLFFRVSVVSARHLPSGPVIVRLCTVPYI